MAELFSQGGRQGWLKENWRILCANPVDEFAVSRDGSGVLVVHLLVVILLLPILLLLVLL